MTIAAWGFAPALAAGNAVVLKPAEWTPLTSMRLGELAAGSGPARGPVPGAARQGLGGRRAVRQPPRRPQDRVHRLDRGRHQGDGRCRRPGQAGDTGARRQERQHRLRRLRPGEGGGDRALRRVRQRRPGLLCAQPNPGAAQRVRQVHGAARAGRQGRWRSATPPPATPRWDRWCRASTSSRWRPTCPTTPRSPSAARPRTGPDTGSRRRCSPRRAPTAPSPRRSSAPSSPCCPSRTRPTPSRWPTTPNTACPARSGPTTSSRALRVSRAVEAGNLSVNSHSSVRYNTPFGGFKQSGLGRELGPDAPLHFTETKNVFFADRRRA